MNIEHRYPTHAELQDIELQARRLRSQVIARWVRAAFGGEKVRGGR